MGLQRDNVGRAFDTPSWRLSADAFFQARGLSLFIMDLAKGATLFSAGRCGYCHLSLDSVDPSPLECYDRPPKPREAVCQRTCRAGLSTYLAPVTDGGSVVAHAVVSGFVSSTRERRRLYEHLIGRGVREEAARLAVRGIPVITRREIEAFARLGASIAHSALVSFAATSGAITSAKRSTSTAEGSKDRDDEATFMEAATDVARVADEPSEVSGRLLATALNLFDAEAGTIALSRSAGYVEMVASSGDGVRASGMKLRLDGGAAARALASGRTVVVRGERAEPDARRRCTVVAPLMADGLATGTLELRLRSKNVPTAREVRRIERFAQFTALAIANAEERTAAMVALTAVKRANEVGVLVDRLTDTNQIIPTVLQELGRSFTFDVAGVVLESWGRDHAEVLLDGDASASEIAMLVGEAAGRDVVKDPLKVLEHHERGGMLIDGEVREHWAFISTPLSSGDHHGGYLFCASAGGTHYTRADTRLLEGVAEHAAAALERAALFVRIRDDFAKTIAALSSSLDARQHAAHGHSARVTEYADLIGETLSLPPEQLEVLRFAGLLHDIGAGDVAEKIMLSSLDVPPDEFERVRGQAELGASVVQQIELLKDVTPAVLHHHERWDGGGYPMGLEGEAIPLLARVLAVADAFESMTGSGHRRRRTYASARTHLRDAAGAQFDPRVVAALLEALDQQALAGSTGLLAAPESKGRPELPA